MNIPPYPRHNAPSQRWAKLCLVFGFIILIVGLAEGLVAGFFLKSAYEDAQTWPRATATITELVAKRSSDGNGHSYYPRFSFTAQDGQSYSALGSVGSNPSRHRVGDEIEVIYPADKPAGAEINSALDLYFLPGAFALMGLTEVVLGAGLLLVSFFLRRKAKASLPPPLSYGHH